jgi:hypothetical protein
MIVNKRNRYHVLDSSGKRTLGIHSTKEEALKQLRAIELSKKRRGK